jgi:hypothetical protein
MNRWATISDCRTYRYLLGRRWDAGPIVGWVMLNPSTADGQVDDPTIRRVIGFSKAFGARACVVGNLYALRATNPDELRKHPDPIGPDNDHYLDELFADPPFGVVAAWGARPEADAQAVASMLGRDLMCLGTTKDGHPRHPLYVPAHQRFEHYAGEPPYLAVPSSSVEDK